MSRLLRSSLSVFLSMILVFSFMPSLAYAEPVQEDGKSISGELVSDEVDTIYSVSELEEENENTDSEELSSDTSFLDEPESSDAFSNFVKYPLPEGTYYIKTHSSNAQVLDVSGNSKNSGANVLTWASSMSQNQQWTISYDSNGFAIIRSVNSGLVLDAAGKSAKSGANVAQYAENGGLNQKWFIAECEDGGCRIVSAANPEVSLDVAGASTKNGANVGIWTNNNSGAQSFDFVSTTVDVDPCSDLGIDGSWVIASNANKAQVIDVAGGSKNVGANIISYSRSGDTNQIFNISFVDSDEDGLGYYRITSTRSGYAVDVEKGNFALDTNVSMAEISSSDSQLFRVEKVGDAYKFICKANGLALDLAGSTPSDCSNLRVFSSNDRQNQLFELEDSKTSYKDYLLNSVTLTDIEDGIYLIRMNSTDTQVLDVCGNSTASGANVEIWESTMGDNQKWSITHDEDGYITITSAKSGLVLDAAGAMPKSGANVSQYNNNGGLNQKWLVVENENGSLTFLNAANPGIALDVTSCSDKNGTNVGVWTANYGKAQSFNLISTSVNVDPCDDLNLDGLFTVNVAANPEVVFDAAGGNSYVGANASTSQINGSTSQLFRMEFVDENGDGKGYYRFVSAITGMALNVEKGNLVPATNISMDNINSNDSELFSVREVNGSYILISKANGLAVELANGATTSGSNLQTNTYTGEKNQLFTFEQRHGFLLDGTCYTIANTASGKLLDVEKNSRESGANVDIWSSNDGLNQHWIAIEVEGKPDTYQFRSVVSGLFLSVDGSNVVQSVLDGENSQWVVDAHEGSLIMTNVGNGECLDVTNNSSANGANVGTWLNIKSKAQLFTLHPTAIISSDYYIIKSSIDSSFVLDVEGKSKDNNANIDLWTYKKGGNQKWYFDHLGNNVYTITSAQSEKAMDIKGGVAEQGTNVIQYATNSNLNQQWEISLDENGLFVFTSVANPSVVLTITGVANGSNVEVDIWNGTANQEFVLERTTYVPDNVPANFSAMYLKAQDYTSATNWLIMVDRDNHLLGIFQKSGRGWTLNRYMMCTTGKASTPTWKGTTIVTSKRYFHSNSYYRTEFFSNTLAIHSVLHGDYELGQSLSNGCIRVNRGQAIWIYNTIPINTKVIIY